jgi:lipopolysaccharide biosynthesis regulator YciM
VDRALEAFNQVLRLDPHNRYALTNLEKLHEEQHQWAEAYRIRQQLLQASEPDDQPRNQGILAFLETELGEQARRQGDLQAARMRFQAALDMAPTTAPAYLSLGDMQLADGQVAQAIDTWQRFIDIAPDRAYLVLGRLETAFARSASPDGFPAL